jgi:hypothetical protein
MKRVWQNIVILVIFFGLLNTVSIIKAAFSTKITSHNNTFSLGTLDLDLKTTTNSNLVSPLFNQNNFKPGDSNLQDIRIKKSGTLDFKYNFNFTKTSGNDLLCNALEVKADLNSTTYYSGTLSSFTLPTSSVHTSDNDWSLTLSLNDSSKNIQNLDCTFDITVQAYQLTSDSTWGFTSQESFSNTVHSGDWTAPVSTTDPLSTYQNSTTFNVPFTATDSGGLVDTIDLYVSYQSGSFSKYTTYDINPDSTPVSDSISFTATNGDGQYNFYTIAKDDSGNTESGVGKTTESQTILDTTNPTTTLSVSSGLVVNETVVNGGFESNLSGWTTQGKVTYKTANSDTSPYEGVGMVKIGHNNPTSGNEVWENKLAQQLQPGAKNLSFYYNFFSYDSGSYDDPGMVVRLNDYNVFYLSADDIDTASSPNSSGWTQLSFDISQINDPVLEIIFYSGNTEDEYNQSWVYIDNISTSEAVADNTTAFTLTPTDNLSGVTNNTYYSFDSISWHQANSFNLSTITGDTLVYYYSIDNAGNSESINTRRLTKDAQPPNTIIDLSVFVFSKHEIDLTWTVPSDLPTNTPPISYDIRYALTPITTELEFDNAFIVPNPPAPRLVGSSQSFTVSGLDSATNYFFAIKSADAALNWSGISNTVSDTTLTHIADPWVNVGDVVVNELMWMGTSLSSEDEFLELKNQTDQAIDLSGWQLTKSVSSTETLMLTIPGGETIPANGYYLISNFDKTNSNINVDPDLVDPNLDLADTNLQINLYDADWETSGYLIDVADNALGEPAAGQFVAGLNYYSMERDSSPGDGTSASSWHTIFDDSPEMKNYWDIGSSEKGTPGGKNLSQTQPANSTITLTLNSDHTQASFALENISDFTSLSYTLTYTSSSGPQGIIGAKNINSPTLTLGNLVLGTCSSGGTCTYHQNITDLRLEVTLNGPITRTLIKQISL